MKWETKAIDNSLNEEIVEGGILLNQAIAGPFKVVANALQRTGSGYPCNSYLIGIEMVYWILDAIERFYLRHPEFGRERIVQHFRNER